MKARSKRIKVILITVFFAFFIICGTVLGVRLYKESHLEEIQKEALQEIEGLDGEYNENKIVLQNTTLVEARQLASTFNARLRTTNDGRFATLTLPENVTVKDIYANDAYRQYIPQLSLDYVARISETLEEETLKEERAAKAPNYTVADTYYNLQSYLNYTNIGDAWKSYRGTGITVAVIDTGIDTDHPEFAGRISEWSYNASEDKIVKDYTLEDGSYDWSLIEDEQGHGTSVTGTIASSMDGLGVVGIAPEVNILVIKAECDEDGAFLSTSDLVFGLYYAIEQDVDVVNMSFGGRENYYAAATKLAVDSDILCVAAAGNEASTALKYPAADENVIGVGALDDSSWELAWYSNYGENVDVVAPGTVYTAAMGGAYKTMNGTSFSSPIVASAMALLKQQNKSIEFKDARELLYASSYDLGALGKDFNYGYGALDINALIVEERGTVTFDMLTDEVEDIKQVFIRNHTLQNLPEPDRNYAVFEGWYYDIHCIEELQWYEDVFKNNLTLYAKWINEDDGVPFTYVTLPDNTIEIRSYTGHRRYITVPEMIDGKVVSSIGDNAFAGETRLRQVNLPSGLTNIGRAAFSGCNNLLEISIPSGVKKIGVSAFSNNVRLSAVIWGTNAQLTEIGSEAFAYCSQLKNFEIPTNVSSVDGSAFVGTTSMRNFVVSKDNAYYMAQYGLLYNKNQSVLVAAPANYKEELTISPSAQTIGAYAFAYNKTKEIDLDGIKNIGACAFEYSALQSVEIPDSVTQMGSGAFVCAFNLKEVTIGSGLRGIADKAFAFTSIQALTIPENILTIGFQAFACTPLQTVDFGEESNLLAIGKEAFFGCNLKEISFPASLQTIGEGAFSSNYSLSKVEFEEGSNLSAIGVSAFEYTISLEGITFPEKLKTIGDHAFSVSALREVYIPASVSYFGAGAFAYNDLLTAIEVAEDNAVYTDVNGVVYNKEKTEIVAYPVGNEAQSYTLETTTEIVKSNAFEGANNLFYVYLPDALTTIEAYGFYQMANLKSVAIPDNVTLISRYAFGGDYNLTSISFTQNTKLNRISYAAFANTGITSFTVPANVSSIAQYAFAGDEKLTSVTFAENSKLPSISAYMFQGAENIQTITFKPGSALTSIQAHGFEGMKKLTKVDFGDAALTNIDNYAFRYCESLTTVNIPEGVTYIGRFAFYGDTKLTRLDLPTTIDFIGRYAFYGAENLDIYFASDFLPNNLQENWDYSIKGYYVGVKDVVTDGDWQYALLNSGNVSIIKYTGEETSLDLTTLDFGADIVAIGGYAFYRSPVTSIKLPATLTSIQRYAFANSSLTSVTIPANVEFIGNNAFFYTPLTAVTFETGSKLEQMEQYAFAYTRSLSEVSLPANLSAMGTYTFFESSIEQVDFADEITMTYIPKHAFASSNLTSVTLPDSVNYIDDNAFRDCLSLQTVEFGTAADIQIHANAFYNTGISSLYIPENVEYIGEYAFIGLEELNAYTVSENNEYYASVDGVLYTKDLSKLVVFPAGRTGEFTVPETVETIGFGAFENTALSAVDFAENINLLTLGYRAFYNADALTEVSLPASLVSIDYYAFAESDNLVTVTFAEGNRLTGIYEGAFLNCVALQNILLPDSIIEISDYAFYGCTALTTIPVSETTELKGIFDYAFAYTGIKRLTIPETVLDIGAYAFKGLEIQTLTVPETNKEELVIGIGAFEGCNRLTEITLPFIGASFEDDRISWFGYIFGAGAATANTAYVPASLKNVTITEGITFVGKGAFYELKDFDLSLPHSITMLYNRCFFDSNVRYELTNEISVDSKTISSSGVHSVVHASWYFSTGIYGELKLADGLESIGEYAFLNCGSLTSVVIPDSVTSIGNYAFSGCRKLYQVINNSEYLSLEDYSTVVGTSQYGYLFQYAKEVVDNVSGTTYRVDDGFAYIDTADGFRFTLENGEYKLIAYLGEEDTVTLPTNINGNEYAIYQMRGVKNVIIPNGITSIGYDAFSGCSSLTSIVIPDSVTSIRGWAFDGCSSLTSIDLPEGVTSIINGAFYGCNSLTNVEIPESVTSIGSYAFNGCSSLTSIEIPDSVTSIGDYAFSGCSSLTSVDLPDSVTSIGSSAFSGCSSLTSIDIPESVTSIGHGAFANCPNLRVSLAEGNTAFAEENGVLYNLQKTQIVFVSPNVTEVTIPNTITDIDSAFEGCKNLTSVIFEENSALASIDEDSFRECSSLTSIEIPEGVTSIGGWAFYNCSSLTSIEIPDSVTSIGGGAFSRCSSLTDIVIPDGVTSIGNDAFSSCSSLTSIVIPDGVTSIGYEAFSACRSLTSINLPGSITSIDDWAFAYCRGLTEIVIPDSITSIGSYAFAYCSNLYQVINNSEYLSLEDYSTVVGTLQYGRLFQSAKEVVDNVSGTTYRTDDGFAYIDTEDGFRFMQENGTYKLIAYLGTEDTVTLPTDINGNEYSIYQMGSVKNVIIPDGVTSIGASAFKGCSSLTSVVIGDGVTRIGDWAFSGCSSLTSIDIPESITSIGSYAFQECSSLTSLEILGSCGISPRAFSECTNLSEIKLSDDIPYISTLINGDVDANPFAGTKYYNDLNNWKDGALFIDNWLIDVQEDVERIDLAGKKVANGAFYGVKKIREAVMSDNHGLYSSPLSGLTNLETLIFTGNVSSEIYRYFGSSASVPITLKNVVLKDDCDVRTSSLLYGITGVTLYVENEKAGCSWDDDYKGWNNGNTVYYGDEWISATFYNENGEIMARDYYSTSQVIRRPFVEDIVNGEVKYVLAGWDLDGDGVVDKLPATSSKNVEARAVRTSVENVCSVKFYDMDGKTLLYSYDLLYGELIALPETPVKTGYDFVRWLGYAANMVVEEDVEFIADFAHVGGGHSYEMSVVAPTCEEEGYDWYFCDVCRHGYRENVVDALGHDWGAPMSDGGEDCTLDYTISVTCKTCGEEVVELVEAPGHEFTWTVVKEPTCQEQGEEHGVCEYCDLEVIEYTEKAEHVFQKCYESDTGRKFSKRTWQTFISNLLKLFGIHIHSGEDSEGYYYYKCVNCGEAMQTDDSATKTYAFNVCMHNSCEWVTVLDASCIDGISAWTCTDCNKAITVKAIPANGVHVESDWIVDVEATCTANGMKHKECSVCGEVLAEETISALGHTEVVDEAVAPTCTETGLTAGKHCSVCNEVLVEQEVVAALGHTEVIDQAVAPTCTETGLTEGKHCSVCNEVLVEQEVVAALGHTEVIDQAVAPTCTETGLTEGKHCSVCNEVLVAQEVVAALGHDYVAVVTAPTCTQQGYTTYTCDCGDTYKSDYLAALGHTEVIDQAVAPTCTETGLTAGKHCSVCNEVLVAQEVVAALGHDYVAVVTAPTCTQQGYTTYTCDCGDTYKSDYLAALGHTEVIDQAVAPTCTETGLTAGKHCSVCNEVLVAQEVVAATQHHYGEWVVVQEPTRTEAGIKEKTCSKCGDKIMENIPATGLDSDEDDSSSEEDTSFGDNNAMPPSQLTGCSGGVTNASFELMLLAVAFGSRLLKTRKED